MERSFEVADFTAIKLSGRHDVIVTMGANESVQAVGEEDALDALEIDAADGTLTIASRRQGLFGFGKRSAPVTLHVTARELNRAAIAGSGAIRIDRIEGDCFEGAIAGSGDMLIDRMEVDRADFRIAGSGDVRAAGRARRAGMRIAGSGDGDLSDLLAEDAEISVAGSGDVKAHATKTARIRVAGSGDVDLTGGAECTVTKAGSGDVRCS